MTARDAPRPTTDDLPAHWEVVSLAGARVRVVQPPRPPGSAGPGGTDVDCVVDRLDPWWPLRLPREYRLCGALHQEPPSWTWVLASDGGALLVDTTDDPHGLGRYGVRTPLLLEGPGPLAPPGARAAYLTLKRLVKGETSAAPWGQIGDLARQDEPAYAAALEEALGPATAGLVVADGLAGRPPGPGTRRQVLRARAARRLLPPSRGLRWGLGEAARVAGRVARPTGLVVLVVGPDGTGKSSVASALLAGCSTLFRRSRHQHWRPWLLPSPATLLGQSGGPADVSRPHAERPHGRLISLGLLGYYWLDFAVGDRIVNRQHRARTGLLVVERGWWDLAVDPRRYRLSVPSGLVRVLGRTLPAPDLTLVLDAPPATVAARKAEIGADELVRQLDAWRAQPPPGPVARLDASAPLDRVVASAKAEVVGRLEARAVSRLGAGWVALPPGRPRWWLPRGPSPTASASVAVHHPVTTRARVGWEVARLAASVGAFRLLPRAGAPPREVRAALAPHLPPGAVPAVARANAPGRYTALVVGGDGRALAVAKVATTDAGRAALRREADAIGEIAGRLAPPLYAPAVVARTDDVVLLERVAWRPRREPWRLPVEVAAGLGAFFAAGGSGGGAGTGLTHGDCAPWNLLRGDAGWALVDWEEASPHGPPFHDVFHHLVQAHALLGRPHARAVVDGLAGRGEVADVLDGYRQGARLPEVDLQAAFDDYLRTSLATLVPDRADRRAAIAARRALLDRPRS